MKPIEDYIRDKTTDSTLRSHLFGILREHRLDGVDSSKTRIDSQQVSQLWDSFGTYTGVDVHAERLHGGTELYLKQFVDSAITSWKTQYG